MSGNKAVRMLHTRFTLEYQPPKPPVENLSVLALSLLQESQFQALWVDCIVQELKLLFSIRMYYGIQDH